MYNGFLLTLLVS